MIKRNLLLVGTLLLFVFLLTGCGVSKKTLVCRKTQEQNGLEVDQEISMIFKKDKIENINMKVDSKAIDDKIKDNWKVFTSTMDSQYKNNESEGLTLKVTNDDKKYTYRVMMDIDLNKVTEESLSEYNLSNVIKSKEKLDDIQKFAEKDGYKCKNE